ncbi:allatotropin receptor [Plakobranchus ocellatus]|uniref:Allatotropin receptor n=1 Tax=Plakobranchus ocellatus TaxID=259542 RepID=A0AAV4AQZ6_9GAST|nr:allatotropin receptor [Plakobranchus ocellatus]
MSGNTDQQGISAEEEQQLIILMMDAMNLSSGDPRVFASYLDNASLAPTPEELDRIQCSVFCQPELCESLDKTAECIRDYIFPTPLEWLFICLHVVLFMVGVLGNLLVCFVVLRSKHMQTVTNLFIVNLAGADAVLLILCSPPSVLQSVTETWWLGGIMCKVVVFFQNTVVGVSVLTLCAIAVERYFAICRPLRSRITMRKVTVTVALIWLVSALLATPNITNIVQNTFTQPELSSYLQSCISSMDLQLQRFYNLFLIVALYLLPLVIIAIFYLIISHHLWNVQVPGATIRGECQMGQSGQGYRNHAEVQLASRKKVAKMLIAIVVLFALFYFPLNLIFVLRTTLPQKDSRVNMAAARNTLKSPKRPRNTLWSLPCGRQSCFKSLSGGRRID